MNDKICALVTNDDGPTSPLLAPLIAALREAPWCDELRVAVPAVNQSWKGASVTRHGNLSHSETTITGHPVKLIGGTPADTASIGIFNLWDSRPDLVISGVNIGENMATPYFYCSGTIGAAGMAALSRVPALAFSLAVPGIIFQLWRNADDKQLATYSGHWHAAAAVTVRITQRLFQAKFWEYADLCTVNLPFAVAQDTPAAFTQLQQGYFRRLFIQDGDCFRHHHETPDFPAELASAESDRSVASSGAITITPLRISSSIPVPKEFQERVLRCE